MINVRNGKTKRAEDRQNQGGEIRKRVKKSVKMQSMEGRKRDRAANCLTRTPSCVRREKKKEALSRRRRDFFSISSNCLSRQKVNVSPIVIRAETENAMEETPMSYRLDPVLSGAEKTKEMGNGPEAMRSRTKREREPENSTDSPVCVCVCGVRKMGV